MIKYTSSIAEITSEMLLGFFVGWPNPPSQGMHLDILDKSSFRVLAIDESKQCVVGFITAISDRILSAYIPLLEVLPEYQNSGIGKELVIQMLSKLENIYMIDIMCDPETQPFYKKCGLTEASGMSRRNYKFQSGNNIEQVH